MQIKAKCAACGSEQLLIPGDGEKDQMIRCAKCNANVGDKKAVNEALRKRAKQEADKMIADLKKGLGKAGFK
ncbi:hypothetical protein [Pseudomonas sp. Ps21-P2]|uniref:hypothetical protein n=1 Tax=Pseudomonas sp. Ps21-P2 TaxID=3080331 RepID=UPI0032091777